MHILLAVVMLTIGIGFGLDIASKPYDSLKEQCRKTNNVYACKIIAVPEEPKP